jgi:hypothetical protein
MGPALPGAREPSGGPSRRERSRIPFHPSPIPVPCPLAVLAHTGGVG